VQIEWRPFEPAQDADRLVLLLTGSEWPFHGSRRPSAEKARGWVEAGRFGNGDEARGFWGLADGEPAAFLAVQELEDPTPIFDLRVAGPWRRRGVGRSALAFLPRWLFEQTDKLRVEGHTRADNGSMRALFRAAGWVQEAHHRRCWPDEAGGWHDATTYALLKADWLAGARTPVPPLDP
jgi:RimJ/RimL family protein N-acetyltransferase